MKVTVKDLCFMAFYIALFMVLDSFVNVLQIFQMPNGGSLGVSTIALLMASYHLGWQKGLIVSLLSVFAQFVTGPMFTPDLLGFVLDYLVAFSVYGLASLFPNYKWFYSGVLVTNFVRFLSSMISGVVIWGTTWWGSMSYQATYMIPTTILTLVVVPILCKTLKPLTNK
ncbi:MAG: energy-coupled thiamine transporter ThiT [Erysipelotrichaceae bacterium]|nr:energy-coupled thiamine transporter ThiT [Erysipelotrichaceae bacterium]MDY5251664.1 energy-coupled thiamine transporter ThiT [Erysipelotrichaceae bacterium]